MHVSCKSINPSIPLTFYLFLYVFNIIIVCLYIGESLFNNIHIFSPGPCNTHIYLLFLNIFNLIKKLFFFLTPFSNYVFTSFHYKENGYFGLNFLIVFFLFPIIVVMEYLIVDCI